MEVFSLGEKNMFKKSSKLFDREGFYIVLFVCLCIVAVTAVYISKYNAKTAEKLQPNALKVQQDTKRNTDPVLTLTKEKEPSVATSKQPVKSKKDVVLAMTKSTKKSVQQSKKTHHVESFKISLPVKGEVVKKYDNKELQQSKTLGQWETHEGIDIACEIGTEVKAACGGKIIEVVAKDEKLAEGQKSGFGARIIIEHANGFRTVYSNLASESLKLKKGESVKTGEVIGNVGDTSLREAVSIEGSHLHFVVLKKSGKDYVSVNPVQFLK